MAQTAAAQGIPPSAIFVEPGRGHDPERVLRRADHAVSWMAFGRGHFQRFHLPRAAMIFSHSSLVWRMHAAPPLQPEASGWERLRFSRPSRPCAIWFTPIGPSTASPRHLGMRLLAACGSPRV